MDLKTCKKTKSKFVRLGLDELLLDIKLEYIKRFYIFKYCKKIKDYFQFFRS